MMKVFVSPALLENIPQLQDLFNVINVDVVKRLTVIVQDVYSVIQESFQH